MTVRRRKTPSKRLADLLGEAMAGNRKIAVMGIGNELRGDDAVGHVIAGDLSRMQRDRFISFAVGTAVENASHLIRRASPRYLFVIDAAQVVSEGKRMRGWDFFPPESINSFIHSTHSLPLSMLFSIWRRENPELIVHFIGIPIGPTRDFAPLSIRAQSIRKQIVAIFTRSLGH